MPAITADTLTLPRVSAATLGDTERPVKQLYGLPDFAFIDMGDFAGGTLKYLRHHPVEKLTLAGGFGKFCKLADGFLDLHSGRSQVNHDHLAEAVRDLGADMALVEKVRSANTAMEVLQLAQAAKIDLATALAAKARMVASEACDHAVDIEILIYDRKGGLVGHAAFAKP